MSTIDGWAELKRKLEQLASVTQKSIVLGAVESGALVIENQAKENCPVLSGNLKRSLHHETVESGADTAVVDIGTNVDYARRVEMGFSGKDSLGRVYNQPPNPYLRGAYEQKREQAVEETAAALKQAVDKASK